jgi:glycine hydroxymethyltransferase
MQNSRTWIPATCQKRIDDVCAQHSGKSAADLAGAINALATRSQEIHTVDCFNLNPATNVMNPLGEQLLASGIGTRPSLGYPGDKYETGLEATEEIEIITAGLCEEIFDARFAEIRIPSGAIANLYGFMAICKPGDTVIVPPASIAGHVTHHAAGCAGLYGLNIIEAPVNADGYTVDLNQLEALANKTSPALITLGNSLNLFEHPVRAVREIADKVGAKVLFDAAHQCGIIAGGAWQNPLAEGAHLMTMSTYKSLGGPASGLIVSNDAGLMQKIDSIAFPGMTANFDAAKTAALAICMLDWREHGKSYAEKMISVAKSLATALANAGVPVYAEKHGYTRSHQFAIEAATFSGGQTASAKLRKAGFLTCGIGLPITEVRGDLNGLRIGTPEIVRFGVQESDAELLADLITRALHTDDPASLAPQTRELRQNFQQLHYVFSASG